MYFGEGMGPPHGIIDVFSWFKKLEQTCPALYSVNGSLSERCPGDCAS